MTGLVRNTSGKSPAKANKTSFGVFGLAAKFSRMITLLMTDNSRNNSGAAPGFLPQL